MFYSCITYTYRTKPPKVRWYHMSGGVVWWYRCVLSSVRRRRSAIAAVPRPSLVLSSSRSPLRTVASVAPPVRPERAFAKLYMHRSDLTVRNGPVLIVIGAASPPAGEPSRGGGTFVLPVSSHLTSFHREATQFVVAATDRTRRRDPLRSDWWTGSLRKALGVQIKCGRMTWVEVSDFSDRGGYNRPYSTVACFFLQMRGPARRKCEAGTPAP